MSQEQGDEEDPSTEIVLLLNNESKGNNLGSILRCASASGVHQILTVGYDKCAVQGAHGANRHVNIIAFPTAARAVDALPERSCIIGLLGALPNGYNQDGYSVKVDVEKGLAIPDLDSRVSEDVSLGYTYPIYAIPPFISRFGRTMCLVISKDRLGLPSSLAEHCQVFCHVPCVNLAEAGPPLLDAPSSLSIALHHLTERLGYDEATFQGHKFSVIKPALPLAKQANLRGERKQEREAKKDEEDDAWEDGAVMGRLWDEERNNDGDY